MFKNKNTTSSLGFRFPAEVVIHKTKFSMLQLLACRKAKGTGTISSLYIFICPPLLGFAVLLSTIH
jgi:hypothetical protein